MKKLSVIFVSLFGCMVSRGSSAEPPKPYGDHCLVNEGNMYDPTKANATRWFTVNLDSPPEERWKEVASLYKTEISELIGVIKNMSFPFFHGKLIQWVDRYFPSWVDKIPEPYSSELKGIANATGMELGEIVLYNVFYEVSSVCTSIVAQDPNGKLFHVRNMDFGLFMGWNAKTHDWKLTERLRGVLINVNWLKGGKTLYKSVNFAGYVGVYNGVKQNKFTVTVNRRFGGLHGGWLGLIGWLVDLTPDVKFSTFLVREGMERADNFDEVVEMYRNDRILAPAYYIVGGVNPGEGVVVGRGLNEIANEVWMQNTTYGYPEWYTLQTNYDPDGPTLFLDDRRTPGNACMQQLGQERVGFKGLFNMLSSKTNLNKLTAYTVLMQVDDGSLETYLQFCKDPCWAW